MSDNRTLTHKSLNEMGSISHAISYHADKIYQKSQNQEAIRRVFLKLVNVGRGTEDTRRVAKFEDFDKNDRETITLLANDRLVITTQNSVEVVHEALIREWNVLKTWIEEYREFLEWEKRTRIDVEFYRENGEKNDNLLRDDKLFGAKKFLKNYDREISREFKWFIEKSVKADNKRKFWKVAIPTVVMFAILYSWYITGVTKKRAETLVDKLAMVGQKLIRNPFSEKNKDLEIYQFIVNEFESVDEQPIADLVEIASNNICTVYSKNKSYEKMIESCRKAIELNPNNFSAYMSVGYAYHSLGKFKEAIYYYKHGLRLKHKDIFFEFEIGSIILFQLQLIENEEFDQKVEKKYIKLFQNKKDSLMLHYEMLKIFQDITYNKKVNLEQWKQKYLGVELDYNFDMLDEWIDGFDEGEVKERLREAMAFFKRVNNE